MMHSCVPCAVEATDRALVTCLTLKLGSYAVVTYLAYTPEVLKHKKPFKKHIKVHLECNILSIW